MLRVRPEQEPHVESVWLEAMGHLVYVFVKPWSLEIGTCEGQVVDGCVCACVLQIDRSIQPNMGFLPPPIDPAACIQLVTPTLPLSRTEDKPREHKTRHHPLPAVFVCNLCFCATAAHPVKGSRSRVVPADLLAVAQTLLPRSVPTMALVQCIRDDAPANETSWEVKR
jgi:hypothetical protein